MTDGYMRILRVFNDNPVAHEFLRDDGEGGFASGVDRMAAEIARLRVENTRLKSGQTYSYLGKDGKSVLARDLEDDRDRLRAELAAMTAERDDFERRLNSDTDEHLWRFWNEKATKYLQERDASRATAQRALRAAEEANARLGDARMSALEDAALAVKLGLDDWGVDMLMHERLMTALAPFTPLLEPPPE